MAFEEKRRANRFQIRRMLAPAVLLVLLAGVGVHLFGFLGVEVFWDSLDAPEFPEPFIRLQPEEDALLSRTEAEYARLFDTAPLFIPTRWNYLTRSEFSGYRLPETPPLFAAFPARAPELPYSPERFRTLLAEPPRDHSRALAFRGSSFFEGFGERRLKPRPLRDRLAALEVVSLPESRSVLKRELTLEDLDGLPESGWMPVDFLIFIDSIGQVGRPYSLGSSGSETVDGILLRWLSTSELALELVPGYYRVEIGP